MELKISCAHSGPYKTRWFSYVQKQFEVFAKHVCVCVIVFRDSAQHCI